MIFLHFIILMPHREQKNLYLFGVCIGLIIQGTAPLTIGKPVLVFPSSLK